MGRQFLLLTISLIALSFFCSGSPVPFQKYIGSEKFAIVGVTNCTTTTQTFVDNHHCIDHMLDHNHNNRSDNACKPFFAVLYVPIEPESIHPPKILMIIEDGKKLAYRLAQIEYPEPNTTITSSRVEVERHSFFINQSLNPSISDIIGVVYDHMSGFLYIMYKTVELGQPKAKADVYYMEPDYSRPNAMFNTFLFNFDVDPYFIGTEWSSDIYSKMFYYHKYEYVQEHGYAVSRLYSIPYGSLTAFLKRGTRGKLEKDFAAQYPRRQNVQVTNDLIYSTMNNESRLLGTLRRKVGGERCFSYEPRSQDFIFVLTGWELCRLRDRWEASLDHCEIEVTEAAPQNTTEPQNASRSGFLWAITLAIIINAVILLIILCVLCKRKDVDKYDNGMYPTNKDPNAALLTPEEIFRRRRTTSTLTEF